MPTIATLAALLGLTVGLGILISYTIAHLVRRRWEERDHRAAIDAIRRTGRNRYTV